MKNRKAMLLIITLIGILFATIYLNLNIFREKMLCKIAMLN